MHIFTYLKALYQQNVEYFKVLDNPGFQRRDSTRTTSFYSTQLKMILSSENVKVYSSVCYQYHAKNAPF